MLIKLIKDIRQKPRASRNKYAFIFAGVFTGVVAMVWSVSVLPNKFSSGSFEVLDTGATSSSFFSDIFKQSKKQLASVASVIENKNNQQEENPELEKNTESLKNPENTQNPENLKNLENQEFSENSNANFTESEDVAKNSAVEGADTNIPTNAVTNAELANSTSTEPILLEMEKPQKPQPQKPNTQNPVYEEVQIVTVKSDSKTKATSTAP